MMSDRLKQFIDNNRNDFDAAAPGPKVLQQLKKQLGQGNVAKKPFQFGFMHWAAMITGVIILSIVLYYSTNKVNVRETVKETPQQIEEKAIVADPVYANQIDHYQELIGLQRTELQKVEKEQPELYRQFASDINQLDSAYRVLKTTLTNNPNREMLLEAMISNLQLQSDLLNRQLLIIKEIKQKSKAHEKSSV